MNVAKLPQTENQCTYINVDNVLWVQARTHRTGEHTLEAYVGFVNGTTATYLGENAQTIIDVMQEAWENSGPPVYLTWPPTQ
jgi:CobQ-like glutamine amidotransferase family enzyme